MRNNKERGERREEKRKERGERRKGKGERRKEKDSIFFIIPTIHFFVRLSIS
jgi:hypothetical protein